MFMGESDSNSDELTRLQTQMLVLESQIKATRARDARQKGLAFESLEDLMAAYPSVSVIRKANIRESFNPKTGTPLVIYGIMGVNLETARGKRGIDEAYDCPNCGIVLGEYQKELYDNTSLLAGSAGEEYNCSICGSNLGRYAWKHC
jgi:predicted RNA-binding Zn-ribbon protein involved in translation (DUF1610 family)